LENEILASTLGVILGKRKGLQYLSVPRSMPSEFIKKIILACEKEKGIDEYAFHVSKIHVKDAISPERATELRSREDDSDADSVIISHEGEFKDLSSLEAFRHVNPVSIPVGISGVVNGELRLDEISSTATSILISEISNENSDVKIGSQDAEKIEKRISIVLRLLGRVYHDSSNDEIPWKDAWWRHARNMIENLFMTVVSFASEQPRLPGWQTRAVYSAAGMPIPNDMENAEYAEKNQSSYAARIRDKWSDGENAALSLYMMRELAIKYYRLRPKDDYPLSRLNWEDDFDASVSAIKHPVLAVSMHKLNEPGYFEGWSSVHEDEFFGDVDEKIGVTLGRLGDDNTEYKLPIIGFLETDSVIIDAGSAKLSSDMRRYELGKFYIELDLDPNELGDAKYHVSTSPQTLLVESQKECKIDANKVRLEFELSTKLSVSGKGKWREKPYKLSIESSISLKGNVKRGLAVLDVLIPFPGHSSFYVSEQLPAGKKGKRKLVDIAQRQYKIDDAGNVAIEKDSNSRVIELRQALGKVDVVITGISDKASLNSKEIKGTSLSSALSYTTEFLNLNVSNADELASGYEALQFSIKENLNRPFSPIISSALGVLPSEEGDSDLGDKLFSDPRGMIEMHLASYYGNSGDSPSRAGLGHIVLFDRDDKSRAEITLADRGDVYYVGDCDAVPTIPGDLSDLEVVKKFWDAFDKLNLGDLCRGKLGETSSWPSRLDLRPLDRERVDHYLGAYHELLVYDRENNKGGWLLYPLSAVIYNPQVGEVNGVMLSPLHPLRLAWAWSVQQALTDIVDNYKLIDAESLLRFVDGDDLPFNGPAPDSYDYLVNQPLDPGVEEIFVTWSYLQSARDVNAGKGLPAKVSGFNFPAGAVSGLDKGGVSAAINDYLRVYPYRSELTIALDGQPGCVRSRELDMAVVSELDNLLRGRPGQLPGGIRILDSVNRQGAAPSKNEILAKVEEATDALDRDDENKLWKIPFEWKRSDLTENMDVEDIRFMEERIVRVEHNKYENSMIYESGSIPVLPIKRSHVWFKEVTVGRERSGYAPGISGNRESMLSNYIPVLGDLENWSGSLVTWSDVITGSVLQGSKANWIVAGNTNLDPHSLSNALTSLTSIDRVLWEWRPSYFPRRLKGTKTSFMSAKPYTVIAKLAKEFIEKVNKELSNSIGQTGPEIFTKLFTELGARGVGISSLLSMGHQQSRGAIGFYMAFLLSRCWEKNTKKDEVRLVLPLDAINPVFETFVSDDLKKKSDSRKKADLVYIQAIKKNKGFFQVRIRPIEVKMHAAESTPHVFPASSSSSIKDAIKQLVNSLNVLDSFEEVFSDVSNRPVLFNTTFTSLIETSLSLSSIKTSKHEQVELAHELLISTSSGKYECIIDDGILLWFERGGRGNNAEPYTVRDTSRVDRTKQYLVDPEVAYDTISECSESRILNSFLKLLDEGLQGSGVILPKESKASPRTSEAVDMKENERTRVVKETNLVSDVNEENENKEEDVTTLAVEKIPVEELTKRYQGIIKRLEEHNVTVYQPDDVEPFTEGPASIIYRIRPAPGVSPSKVTGNDEVLKLELRLSSDQDIRIVTHEGNIVVDVPKKDEERYYVNAKDLWDYWLPIEGSLAVPLGLDQYKNIVDINFSSHNAPHLLIGGTTGSGKSEALNTILYGLIHYFKPEELKLMLVDPKGTELNDFEESPYLVGNIGWDDDDAIKLLDNAVQEMNRRYDLFKGVKKRSLPDYNNVVGVDEKIPWWIIVLDEYADLTSDKDAKKKIEDLLKRLAQKARASGIHVIIATQKPSGDVISTNLRSNLPAQLALKVKSSIESRVVMDETGAETLNGKGDAFLKSEGRLVRIQCARYDK